MIYGRLGSLFDRSIDAVQMNLRADLLIWSLVKLLGRPMTLVIKVRVMTTTMMMMLMMVGVKEMMQNLIQVCANAKCCKILPSGFDVSCWQ